MPLLYSLYAGILLRRNERNCKEIFVKKTEIVLDKLVKGWYHNRACVGILCAYCDDAGDCVQKGGNFRGVCPVIGRLNCFCFALRISLRQENGRPCVGHFSWLGMIRTAARTVEFDRTQTLRKLGT